MEQGSVGKKTLASTLQLFKDIGHHTSNLMSGKQDDEEEDPDYIKVGYSLGIAYASACRAGNILPFAALKPLHTVKS